MKTALTVLTCLREHTSYLAQTLRLLDAAGAAMCERRLVMSDGPLNEPDVLPSWQSAVRPGPSGSRVATWRALKDATRSGCDQLLLVQDDVTPCTNAVTQMIATEIPEGMAMVSFFDIHMCRPGAEHGIYRVPVKRNGRTKDFCGAQCILFPMRTVTFLAEQDPFSMPDEPFWHPVNSCDPVMGHLLERSPWRTYGVHVPCLVEHRGDESISHPDKRPGQTRASNFPGREFDALTLGKLPVRQLRL